jgi:hypothetical protein
MSWSRPLSAEGTKQPSVGQFIADALGFKDPKPSQFVDDLVRALEKLDPSLVPKSVQHPLVDRVLAGVDSLDELVAMLSRAPDDDARATILDVIGEIFRLHYPTLRAVEAVYAWLGDSQSMAVVNACCKALAFARDDRFIADQRRVLVGSNPYQAACAARLLAMAGDVESVPHMIAMLHPGNMVMADSLVWALGELRASKALLVLHTMVQRHVLIDDVLEAIGKIGDVWSLEILVSVLTGGTISQRELAAEAVVKILKRNDAGLESEPVRPVLRSTLDRVLRSDSSAKVRFYCAIALAIVGEELSPSFIKQTLCTRLTSTEADAMGAMLSRRASPL